MEEIIEIPVEEPVKENIKKVKSKSPSYNNETNDDPSFWSLVLLRNTRNAYLQLTDKYLLSDFPISDEKRYEIMEYRQYLRNFININQEAILKGENIEILPIPI